MIASLRSLRRGRLAAPVLAALLVAACAKPTALPHVSAIDRRAQLPIVAPDVADYAAARLAAAALVARGEEGRERVERSLRSLAALERVLEAADEPPTGLLAPARDLAHASLDDHHLYREKADELLDLDLDPFHEKRLEQFVKDDLLKLASARIWDDRHIEFARAFNALAEPAGRSIMNMSFAPYRFAQSALKYAIELYQKEPLTLQRRQALGHWKDFLERYPDDPRAKELEPRVAKAQALWNRTYRNRMMKRAKRSMDVENPRLALIYADRALRYAPEYEKAEDLRESAAQGLLADRARRRRSVSAAPGDASAVAPPEAAPLALALFAPGGDVTAQARDLLESDPEGPLADEARFALALGLAEEGREKQSWREIDRLADQDDDESNMARHARRLADDPIANPYAAFRSAQKTGWLARAKFVLLGPWAHGPPKRGLPAILEWPLGLPSLPQAMFGAPMRLLQLPWSRAAGADRSAALSARRYLALYPEGEFEDKLRGWLSSHEKRRGNWLAVFDLVRDGLEEGSKRLLKLRERAAKQSLELAGREAQRGLRLAMLRRVATEFPGTEAASEAGLAVRKELEEEKVHEIQLTRGFLLENPKVAGLEGLALRAELLDGDGSNGELHPKGVALIGGRVVEFSMLPAGGDRDDEPERWREELEPEHLARLVSLLEETSYRNALLDPDATMAPDARRDRFFDQARLGIAETIDPRPEAAASFRYESLRERYGMVRSRESILPFDLVLQGSFTELNLGAFPRIRKPRETPDAIFYK